MTRYRAGADFERKVRDHLLAEGARLVVRSAGSRGPVDLVAFPGGPSEFVVLASRATLVQVKRDAKLSKAARAELVALADDVGAEAVLAYPAREGRRVVVRLEVL